MLDRPEAENDEILAARQELQAAYQFFNWATEPRFVDEAIRRIQAAESRLDNLTHASELPEIEPFPWLESQNTRPAAEPPHS